MNIPYARHSPSDARGDRASLAGLKLPCGDDGVFDGIGIAVFEVHDKRPVLGEAVWHRERVRERARWQVLESGADARITM